MGQQDQRDGVQMVAARQMRRGRRGRDAASSEQACASIKGAEGFVHVRLAFRKCLSAAIRAQTPRGGGMTWLHL
jgi:hypothetical protein